MQTLIKNIRLASRRFAPGPAVVTAMLLGPAIGALLAFGAVAAQEENVVTIDKFTFTAPELTVAVGTTVKFVNHDDIPHTVVDTQGRFKSPPMDTGDTYEHTFVRPGTYEYFCSVHPHMTGRVVAS